MHSKVSSWSGPKCVLYSPQIPSHKKLHVCLLLVTFRCEKESQSDYVLVSSDDATSNRRMCGASAQYTDVEQFRSDTEQFRSNVEQPQFGMEQFRSDSNHLYVEFRSNDVFDATGFEAVYQFYSPVQGTYSLPT